MDTIYAGYTLRIMADGQLVVADRTYGDAADAWEAYDEESARWGAAPVEAYDVTIQLSDRDGDVLAEVTL